MKYLLAVMFFTYINAGAQKVYSSKRDIADAKEIIFYGYDFSHFTLSDAKRLKAAELKDPAGISGPVGLKKYLSAWFGYLTSRMNETYFEKRLKTSEVIFDFDFTLQIIKESHEDELLAREKTTIPLDSIADIIRNYQVKQSEGIGFSIIVECFNKKDETSSAYFTFFDIATKHIIMCDRFATSHADGIGLTNHWGYGFHYTVDSYMSNEFKWRLKSKK